jgi:Icc-related predicted phosphoesterase
MLGMMELFLGRARRFELDRLQAVIDRVLTLEPDHLVITGDLTTTALPAEFQDARRQLTPLLTDPGRVSIVPGNHDRATLRSFRSHRFETAFSEFLPRPTFPWLRQLDDETSLLGLDPTRSHLSARGLMPEEQLREATSLITEAAGRARRLVIACHYPVLAPAAYRRELHLKRMINDERVCEWLETIGPHLYCCGHVHAAWAFQPERLPNQICVNSGAPLMRDPTGLRLPGFLEILLEGDFVTVKHHAWNGTGWVVLPMLHDINLLAPQLPVNAR